MAEGDVYQLNIEATVDGNFVQSVYHFYVNTDPGLSPFRTAEDVALAFKNTLQSTWLGMLAADYLLLGYNCKRVFDGGGQSFNVATPGAVGSVSGVSDASIMGGIIEGKYMDPLTTKWRSLRSFLPGAPSAFIESSVIQAAYNTAMNAFVAILAVHITGPATGQYIVCGFKRKPSKIGLLLTAVGTSLHIGIIRKRARPEV